MNAVRRATRFDLLSVPSKDILRDAFLILHPVAADAHEDNSGGIELSELRDFAETQGHAITDKILRKAIRTLSIDMNYDAISFLEFCTALGGVEGEAAEDVAVHFLLEHIINVSTLFGAPLYVQMERDKTVPDWRVSLARFADGTQAQVVCLALIVLDVVCVGSELLLVYTKCDAPTARWTNTEHKLHKASVSVLLFFGLQIVLCMIAYGKRFFHDFFQMFDAFIIFFSLFMELVLHVKEGGLFVLLLSWRVVRIVHGLLTSAKLGKENTNVKKGQAALESSKVHNAHLEEIIEAMDKVCEASESDSSEGGKATFEQAVRALAKDIAVKQRALGHSQQRRQMEIGTPKAGKRQLSGIIGGASTRALQMGKGALQVGKALNPAASSKRHVV
jgi:hypothetical protein